MRVYHATDERNLRGWLRSGGRADLASGRRAAIWVVTRDRIDYAILHCCTRRGVPVGRVVVLELDVPRSWVRKFGLRGVAWIPRDVPPSRVRVYGRISLTREG